MWVVVVYSVFGRREVVQGGMHVLAGEWCSAGLGQPRAVCIGIGGIDIALCFCAIIDMSSIFL